MLAPGWVVPLQAHPLPRLAVHRADVSHRGTVPPPHLAARAQAQLRGWGPGGHCCDVLGCTDQKTGSTGERGHVLIRARKAPKGLPLPSNGGGGRPDRRLKDRCSHAKPTVSRAETTVTAHSVARWCPMVL